MTNWRQSEKYITARETAFTPYRRGSYIACAGCGRILPENEISASHIYTVGAWYNLRCEPTNIVPMCLFCHSIFERMTRAEKDDYIERLIPGRIALLGELRRRDSESV
jgi:hypothetical protein